MRYDSNEEQRKRVNMRILTLCMSLYFGFLVFLVAANVLEIHL